MSEAAQHLLMHDGDWLRIAVCRSVQQACAIAKHATGAVAACVYVADVMRFIYWTERCWRMQLPGHLQSRRNWHVGDIWEDARFLGRLDLNADNSSPVMRVAGAVHLSLQLRSGIASSNCCGAAGVV
jgi:hypothetical protein